MRIQLSRFDLEFMYDHGRMVWVFRVDGVRGRGLDSREQNHALSQRPVLLDLHESLSSVSLEINNLMLPNRSAFFCNLATVLFIAR